MSRIIPAGQLNWVGSDSPDVAGYNVYYATDQDPDYDSPHVDAGNTTTIALPLEGQAPVEGDIHYGIAAYDKVGNESDIVPITVTLDTVPPDAPTDVEHTV